MVILLSIGTTQAYIQGNNGGSLKGTVVDSSGEPVANATVRMEARGIEHVVKTAETKTDSAGQFEFRNYTGLGDETGLEIIIRVIIDGHRIPSQPFHAHFPNENMNIVIVVERPTGTD